MNDVVHRICIGLLLTAFVAAVAEIDFEIVIALAATGFTAIVVNGLSAGIADNDRYRAALLAHSGGSADEVASVSGDNPFLGLFVLVAFAVVSGATIAFDSPAIIGVAFALTIAIGVPWQIGKGRKRELVWKQFADSHGLVFTPSQLWDRHENGRISGDYQGRPIRLEIVWQDKATAGSSTRTEVLVAETQTSVTDEDFCVDNLENRTASGTLVTQLMETPAVFERLAAARTNRISLSEGQLLFFFLRIPRTQIELSFYSTLLAEVAAEIETLSN